ncbi:prostaglandin reductase 1 [Patella vulgata]|uniref:prostaglandin reductase 1 n=1 Tax=Patella vulgata TaxID=6465 RepID=UPI0024A9260C|nr:prostaglandin reductase 1 [Patella vulgata]
MVKAKKWILKKQFEGLPKKSDFELVEEDLSRDLKDGEVLVESAYLSVDPYMRVYKKTTGDVMIGSSVGKVLKTNNKNFKVGDKVVINAGWRTHAIVSDKVNPYELRHLAPLGDLPLSAGLGVMGMPGMTAYFGLVDVCKPKVGETVLVNGAAGAVGSVVGQLAKIKGCTVIGFAGTKEKCDWLKSLNFDHVFNYKETDVKTALDKAAPKGIDIYFDNVGGDFTVDALNYMNVFGRILVCGAISTYHDGSRKMVPDPFMTFLQKKLTVYGFIVTDVLNRWGEAFPEMLLWLQQGKLQFRETVTEGFENMPEAFQSLFSGGNTGKAVVKA